MKILDWPQIWALGFLAAVWGVDRALPFGGFGGAGRFLGPALLILGLVLMGLAVAQMTRSKTTVNPRGMPAALVTKGVFALSRNPIYLGDALVILAAIFWWDVPLALPLLAVFVWVIQSRFILGEEARLREGFGDAYTQWSTKVRRWI